MLDYRSLPWPAEYRTWSVQRASREPLVRFLCASVGNGTFLPRQNP